MTINDLKYITPLDIQAAHLNVTSAEMYDEAKKFNQHMYDMQVKRRRFLCDKWGIVILNVIMLALAYYTAASSYTSLIFWATGGRGPVGMATGDLAGAYDAFAQVCSMKKEDGLALEYFHKSLNMTQQLFGEYHVNTTHCYTALGQEQLRQGLFSEAEDSFRRVIGILDMILEEKADEQILQGYGNLMKLYTKMGEAEKADEMKKKIAELRALSRGDKTE